MMWWLWWFIIACILGVVLIVVIFIMFGSLADDCWSETERYEIDKDRGSKS